MDTLEQLEIEAMTFKLGKHRFSDLGYSASYSGGFYSLDYSTVQLHSSYFVATEA